jgi:thioredoxin:protein disulfide reductase
VPKLNRFSLLLLVSTGALLVLSFAGSAFAGAPVVECGTDGGTDALTTAINEGQLFVAAGLMLLAGLAVSLTPCVYPMVSITVSVFGARETKSKREGLMLSAAFVAGIIAVFTPLGVIAGVSGEMMGSFLQNEWVLVAMAVLFLAMAVSMFGAFNIGLPSSITNRLAQVGGIGYKGAFLLGVACGPIAAPCSGPPLIAILTWIGQSQDVVLGAGMMALFSLGLGMPFFLVGAFAMQLPKSGKWMVHVKSVMGLIMFGVALYYLQTAFPELFAFAEHTALFIGVSLAVAALGIALGAVHMSFDMPGVVPKLRKGFGVLLTTGGLMLALFGFMTPTHSLEWAKIDAIKAQGVAAGESRPLLLDFTASWCASCKELDKLTFSDEGVRKEGGRFLAVKVDMSDNDDPRVQEFEEVFDIQGLPKVLFYDSQGRGFCEYKDFVDAEGMLRTMKSVN